MKIKIKGFDDDSYRDIYGVLEGEERQGKFCIGENGKIQNGSGIFVSDNFELAKVGFPPQKIEVNRRSGSLFYIVWFKPQDRNYSIGIRSNGAVMFNNFEWQQIDASQVKAIEKDLEYIVAHLQVTPALKIVSFEEYNNTEEDLSGTSDLDSISKNETNFNISVPEGWEITKEEFYAEGIAIVNAKNEISKVQIKVDEIKPKEFSVDVSTVTTNGLEHLSFSSSIEEETINLLYYYKKFQAYNVASDLLKQCINKVRNKKEW